MPTPAIAANAYAALAQLRDQSASLGRDASAQDGGVNFGSVLKDVMQSVTAIGQKSDVQARAVATGKANMIDVVTAVSESETAIQTMVSVRDKVIAAYEEILKMPIRPCRRPRGGRLEKIRKGRGEMTGPEVMDVARDAIVTLILVSAPLMLAGLVVGVAISLPQALTQIQETTLVFVPKILAIFVAMLIALPFMADALHSNFMRIAAHITNG